MRRHNGLAWVPFVRRSAGGAVRAWPRLVPAFTHFAATAGSESGDGSIGSPWSLQYALDGAGGAVRPGDTVWIRGGTYITPAGTEWSASVSGADARPITFRAYLGERVILDSADTATTKRLWRATGNYLRIWGLEWQFTGSLIRTSTQTTGDLSNPSDVGSRNAKEVRNEGHYNQYIWCISHDNCNGFSDQNVGTSYACEYHHCLSYNNGWVGTDRGHGHGFYMQNQDPTGKLVEDSVVFGNFSTGVKISGTATAYLKYFTVRRTCSFDNEVWGGGGGDHALHIDSGESNGNGPHVVVDNLLWTKAGLGNAAKFNDPATTPLTAVEVRGNLTVGQVVFNECDAYTIQDNTLTFFQDAGAGKRAMNLRMESGQPYTTHAVEGNTVVMPTARFPWFLAKANGSTALYNNLADWQAETGYDLTGTHVDALKLSGATLQYRPDSTYQLGDGWIYCVNWDGAESLDVDLSELGLVAGDSYEVHHVYDVFGTPVASGTYDGSTALALGQTGYVHPTPLGWDGALPASASPYLNVFRVRKA